MVKFYKILSMLCFALAIVSAVTYVKDDPFLAFVCGFFGIALGIVLYEVSELRESILHLRRKLHLQASEENKPVQAKSLHPVQK